MTRQTIQPKKTFTLCRETNLPGRTIGRDQILSRLFALANLTPVETKDNIAGQLKALDSLCEQLGLKEPESKVQPIRTAEIFRAEWLDEDMKTIS